MRLYVGITDYDWFKLHASKAEVEEVNFWKPSSQVGFRTLQWGEPFLFKLKSRKYIGGGGFFTKFLQLPLSLAWETFGEGNGARSLSELRALIGHHRLIRPDEDPLIGCILLEEPFFFEQSDWIELPTDFRQGIQMGKTYEMESGTGLHLWQQVRERLDRARVKNLGPATIAAQRYGAPTIVAPRLGQGSFRALVTDAYRYRCAMTSERTLPVLEAAHIRSYVDGGEHALSNGLLLRSDLHTLFDQHYLTIEPKKKTIVVSRRIRDQYENGRDYYVLNNRPLAQPANNLALPSLENLAYHFERFTELESS